MARERFAPRSHQTALPAVPFGSAEEAWFWFVQAQDARASGARFVAGLGEVERPCEPVDMMRVVDRLYRRRRLMRDHLCVLVHYGRRLTAPDPDRRQEQRACALWREALGEIAPVLREKGIVAGAGAPPRGNALSHGHALS